MAGGRICAGYYRLFDSRAVNEDSLVADADTGRGDDHLDCLSLCRCPQVLHLQQKAPLRLCRSGWRMERQMQAADEHEGLSGRHRKAGRQRFPGAGAQKAEAAAWIICKRNSLLLWHS